MWLLFCGQVWERFNTLWVQMGSRRKMKIDKAREIAAEHSLEEGATYNWHKMGSGELLGEVTITNIKSSGQGAREVAYRIDLDDKAHEDEDSIASIAGKFESGFWRVPDSE